MILEATYRGERGEYETIPYKEARRLVDGNIERVYLLDNGILELVDHVNDIERNATHLVKVEERFYHLSVILLIDGENHAYSFPIKASSAENALHYAAMQFSSIKDWDKAEKVIISPQNIRIISQNTFKFLLTLKVEAAALKK